MADQNTTQLTEATTVADTDLLYTVVDPAGTPVDRKVTVSNLLAGAPTVARPGGLAVGRWYDPAVVGDGPTSASGSANVLTVHAVEIPRSVTIDRVGMFVSSASTAGSVRLGIYEAGSTGFPDVLVVDAGTISTSSTGAKELTVSVTVGPGIYWLAWVADESFSAYGTRATAIPHIGYNSLSGDAAESHLRRTFTYAALPSPYGTVTFASAGGEQPQVRFRIG